MKHGNDLNYSEFNEKHVGIDEVGHGCWAGPLFICALKFKEKNNIVFYDSKSISIKKRENYYDILKNIAEWNIGIAEVDEINEIGLAFAYKNALFRATNNFLGPFIIDGRKPKYFDCTAIIDGDKKIQVISAASIVAKVLRDKLMRDLHEKFPIYNWNNNKGYGTKKHIEAIKQNGFCKHHRKIKTKLL